MNKFTSVLRLTCNQLAQKTFYRNYNLNYRKEYEDVKAGNDSGKFRVLATFSFCLLLFMAMAFNFVKTNSVTRHKKFHSKSKCVAFQQVRKSRPTFSIKVLICSLCYFRILNSWMISSGTLSCTGSANRAGQRSGQAQGWKGYEVLSSDTLGKRSDYWINTPTKIKKCMNIYWYFRYQTGKNFYCLFLSVRLQGAL
jgi:hypothetical protein